MKRWVLILPAILSIAQSPTPAPSPTPGDVIPAFDAEGMAGSRVHVDFPKGSKTVLIFFLAGCPHCERMFPQWNLSFEHKPPKLRVLGVLMNNEPAGYFQLMHVSFPVVRAPSNEFLHNIKVFRAPITIRVSEGGKVDDVAVSEVDGIRLGQLFAP